MHIGRCTGVLFQTLLCWTLIEHCSAGHRPYKRWERPHYPRQNDRWTQRVEYPSVNDEGTQGLPYPSVHGRGQEIRYPSISDSDASAQIQVKMWRFCCFTLHISRAFQGLRYGSLVIPTLLSESKEHALQLFGVTC